MNAICALLAGVLIPGHSIGIHTEHHRDATPAFAEEGAHMFTRDELGPVGIKASATMMNVAHRGLWVEAKVPQNTVEAIKAAYDAGAQVVETDFNETACGEMICLHDKKALLTMVSAFDKEVKDLTPEDRATINLGEKAKLPRAYRIPTLDEVLAVVPKDRVLQSEIKLYGPGYADKFDAAVKRAGLTEKNITVSSFDLAALKDFHAKYPKYETIYLLNMRPQSDASLMISRCRSAGVDVMCPSCTGCRTCGFTPEEAEKVRQAGIEFRVYGVNDPELLRYAVSLGATGFTCNTFLKAYEWAKDIPGLTLLPRRCPRWISVMPLAAEDAEGVAADAIAQGNETIIDGIAWIMSLCPAGNPAADLAARYAADYRLIEPSVRARSKVKQGVLLQSTMGHGGFPGEATPWQLSVKADGTSVYRMCPLDPRFLDYIAKACRTLAALKPDFFMVDDDTRLHWGGVLGCFCPLHLAALEKATGRAWTREEAAKRAGEKDADFLKVWEKVYFDSMAAFFRTIRANFDPETPGMLCTVSAAAHFRHAKAFAQMLAAPGQVPVVRGNGANYGGNDIYHCIDQRSSFACQLRDVGSGVVFLQEADTCPQQLWSCSATREYESMVLQALEGVKGAKIWITRTVMTRERRSQAAYRRILSANRGILEWAAKTDFRQTGVVVPNVGCGDHARGWSGWAERYLALTGIPYRYGEAASGEVTALCASTLTCLDRAEIERILSGPVLLDGTGANWLAAHGFADLIGADAKPWARKTIQRHLDENGVPLGGMRVDGELADLTALHPGAEILSRLYNVPSRGAAPAYEAPGSIVFTNARGGRIIALAQPLRSSMPAYYNHTLFSESYQAWIARLIERLGGTLPVRFAGAGPVLCEAGRTMADGDVFVLNPLDIDDLVEPEMAFARRPDSVERLMGDGVWKPVSFVSEPTGFIRLKDTVRAKNPTVYRIKEESK